MNNGIRFIVFGLILFLSGCAYWAGPSRAARQSTDLMNRELALLKSRQQDAAANVEAARKALELDPTPSRNSKVAERELELGAAVLPNTTPAQLMEINARLKLALSESEADRIKSDDLYNSKLGEYQKLQDTLETLTTQHRELEQKLVLSDAEAKARAGLVSSIIHVLVIAGIATAVGAVLAFRFFPSLAIPAGILAGIFFGGAYLAATIQPWMLYVGAALSVVAFALFAIYSHRQKMVADATVGALQEVRNDSEELWQTKLKPKLADWVGSAKGWVGKEIERKAVTLNQK